MGARTTWEIRTSSKSPSIYLYSHWGGDSKWSDTVAALRAAEPRWEDPTYGARIFISQIVGNDWNEETGYGITAGVSGEWPFEEEYFPVLVDFSNQTVETSNGLYKFSEFTSEEIFSVLV